VSDPMRYLSLHPVADLLVSRLVSRFRVEAEPAEVEGRWRSGVERATRLVPEGDGTPVTVIWTGFGVAVEAGHAYDRGFPVCGCDACDEDPDHLAQELEETLDALATGGLTEERRSRRFGPDEASIELRSSAGSSSSTGPLLEPDDPRHAIPAGTTTWPPWPYR